ncbi:MAG: aldo/keto reductase [Dehalococcoidales bacterium]|nr:MAG: aldo/keto reductase [Dehalococcoidales bacterium]
MAVQKRKLGKTDIEITPVGLGCWQFYGSGFGRLFWKSPPQQEVNNIIVAALDGGINWFDTAEAYGSGKSERALSTGLTNAGMKNEDVVIATKWQPFFRTAKSISRTVGDRQKFLSPFGIDLHQVHFPSSFSSIEAQMDAMAALVREGKIRSVGISNFSTEQMRQAQAALEKHGLPLASNQVRFNLLDRKMEKQEVLSTARELGITIIDYSPLAQGLLTGKFHKNPALIRHLPFYRKRATERMLEKSRPLINLLEEISSSYNATPSEVALSWLINYAGDTLVAIPGASKADHIAQNMNAMNLKLTDDKMKKLDEMSREIVW